MIERVTLWNVQAFEALIANAERVTIRDVTMDHGGVLSGERIVDITFSQVVKAADFKAGARIDVNGSAANIVSAVRDTARSDTVHYEIDRSI